MAYQGKLINPLRQYGSASYDLVLEDDDGELPPLRSSVSLALVEDTPERRQELSRSLARAADQVNTKAARKQRLEEERDQLDAQLQQLGDRRKVVKDKLDRDDV